MVEFAFLRQRGIELLQRLCGESWTDYNLHDPGVTILEALCYALTDLSYRTEFPMSDLLADKEGKIRLHDHAFHTPEEILSSSPVSVADFRKFILDQMNCLQNVWLEPFISGFSYGTMHGLYSMKVQVKKGLSENLGIEDAKGEVRVDEKFMAELGKKVRGCHMSARNLCEDVIRDVMILRPVPITIHAEVVITGEQPELILAHIYRDLELAINPPVRYYTERDLLNKGYRVEEIYAGPKLNKGHIPDDGLQPRKTLVDPAELMKAIAQVAGVEYVRSLVLHTPKGSTDRIPYQIPKDGYPYFRDGLAESPIRLLRGKYDVKVRESVFKDIWDRVKDAMERSIEPVVDPQVSSDTRQGEYRDVVYYRSLQHLFPVAYGIGEDGPGARPTALRLAQVHQLKGYLLSFEQVLADYLAQLGHIGEYFSVANKGRTFFTQSLDGVPGVQALLGNRYKQMLAEVTETEEDYLTRRGVMLDHLLARFNERPVDYPVRLYGQLYGDAGHPVLDWKSWLLTNIIQFSYGRVRGFNYLDKDGTDRGGFVERMRALLYIRDGKEEGLAAAVYPKMQMRKGKVSGKDKDGGVEAQNQNWVSIVDADKMRQLLGGGAGRVSAGAKREGAVPGGVGRVEAGRRPPTEEAAHFGHRGMGFFRHGLNIGNYTIGPDVQGPGWLILFKEPADKGWQVISRHADERTAVEGLRGIMEVLREMSKQSEGFYLVENVLLRPAVEAKSFGFRFRASGKEVLMQHARWMGFMERERVLTKIMKAAKMGPGDAAAGSGAEAGAGVGGAAGLGDAEAWIPEWAGGEEDEAIAEWGVRHLGGRCRVQLERHKEYGFLSDPADLEPWIWLEVAKDFRHIRQQLLLASENKLKFYPRFDMLVKGQDDNEIREEFFNFNMTVLLPAWPARFQDPNFRAFIMDVFRQQTPAHIRLYFQWLNVTRMREFEHIYPKWINAMKDQDDPEPRRQLSDQLIHFIKRGVY